MSLHQKTYQNFLDSLPNHFSTHKKEVTLGLEAEMYLVRRGQLVDSQNLMNSILLDLPKQIVRDWYPYQLEIRTDPHKNPEDSIKQLASLFETCTKVCAEYGCEIIPLSWLGGGEMYNGVHVHVRYPEHKNPYWKMMMNSYPFMLSIAGFFRNSPSNFHILSNRMLNSQHLALPVTNPMDFSRYSLGSNRYKDIIINKHKENDRHRMKSVSTLEIRMFDVPNTMEYFDNLLRVIFKLYQHLKVSELTDLSKQKDYANIAKDTRQNMLNSRHSKNLFFNLFHEDVMNGLCEHFNIPFLESPYPALQKKEKMSNYVVDGNFPTLISMLGMDKKKLTFDTKQERSLTREELEQRIGSASPDVAASSERRERESQSLSNPYRDAVRRQRTLSVERENRITLTNTQTALAYIQTRARTRVIEGDLRSHQGFVFFVPQEVRNRGFAVLRRALSDRLDSSMDRIKLITIDNADMDSNGRMRFDVTLSAFSSLGETRQSNSSLLFSDTSLYKIVNASFALGSRYITTDEHIPSSLEGIQHIRVNSFESDRTIEENFITRQEIVQGIARMTIHLEDEDSDVSPLDAELYEVFHLENPDTIPDVVKLVRSNGRNLEEDSNLSYQPLTERERVFYQSGIRFLTRNNW